MSSKLKLSDGMILHLCTQHMLLHPVRGLTSPRPIFSKRRHTKLGHQLRVVPTVSHCARVRVALLFMFVLQLPGLGM